MRMMIRFVSDLPPPLQPGTTVVAINPSSSGSKVREKVRSKCMMSSLAYPGKAHLAWPGPRERDPGIL